MFPLGRAGWLAVNTPVTGWRWLRCYRALHEARTGEVSVPDVTMHLDIVLIAEDPRAETAPVTSQWRSSGDQGKGNLWVTGGERVAGMAELSSSTGPGR